MSVTIEIDLPESIAAEARERGLLQAGKLAEMIKREIVSKAALKDYFDMVETMRAYPDEPMPMDEIQIEVDAVLVGNVAVESRWAD